LKKGWFSWCGSATIRAGKNKTSTQENTQMKNYEQSAGNTSAKASAKKESVTIQYELPMSELIDGLGADIERFSAEIGLRVIQRVMEAEIASRIGSHGRQSNYRHGTQSGYVIFGGRKVTLQRPRMRQVNGSECQLKSYRAFQSDGRMQQAVARQLIRQCSTRNYARAIDDCLKGYGIDKSSVSRHWKAASAEELQQLCTRPIPTRLVALLIDGKHLRNDCVVVALGVDPEGKKHVLGLWHGATENATVVRDLLADLVERGLESNRPILVVIDGAKALRKAVGEVFGSNALVQRCRIHKRRNVLDYLNEEHKSQASLRLRAAWSESDPVKAEAELRKTVRWLRCISPSAARSLEEGLEETLTVNRLGLKEHLLKSLSSTNLIESCFSHTQSLICRVKRWRDGQMFLRWMGASLLVAESNFRKVRGFQQIPLLIAALENFHLDLLKHAA
jgi:putative transposase